jgi:hypothetical protein
LNADGPSAPVPLQFGLREGLPLMLEVTEDNTVVIYRAFVLTPGEPDHSRFSVPPGYTVIPREPGG